MSINLQPGNVKSAMRGAASRDLWQVPYDELKIAEGFNVRSDNDEKHQHIAMLAQLIIENGYRQDKPLTGFIANEAGRDVVYIADGHCRHAAIGIARTMGAVIETVPVVVTPRGTNMEDLTVGLAVSNTGKALAPYEIGEVCKRLIGYGWDEPKIAKRLGMTAARVGELLDLVGSDRVIRDAVQAGEVSATTAIATMKEHGQDAAQAISEGVKRAKAAGKKKATRRDVAPDKPGCKQVCRELIEWAKVTAYELPDDLKPVLSRARKAVG